MRADGRTHQNHSVGDLLEEERIPFDSTLAFKLVFAIFLSVLLDLGTAEARIYLDLMVIESFIDR